MNPPTKRGRLQFHAFGLIYAVAGESGGRYVPPLCTQTSALSRRQTNAEFLHSVTARGDESGSQQRTASPGGVQKAGGSWVCLRWSG